jgi:hypothetical protein
MVRKKYLKTTYYASSCSGWVVGGWQQLFNVNIVTFFVSRRYSFQDSSTGESGLTFFPSLV